MKEYLSILIICAGATLMPASAGGRTMVVTTNSSGAAKLEVSEQTRISFSKDLSTMIVSSESPGNPITFAVDDIADIAFSMSSSVDCAPTEFSGLQISNTAGVVAVSGAENIEYAVCDTSGRHVVSGSGRNIVTINFTGCPAGIYIIKANNSTLKFINR